MTTKKTKQGRLRGAAYGIAFFAACVFLGHAVLNLQTVPVDDVPANVHCEDPATLEIPVTAIPDMMPAPHCHGRIRTLAKADHPPSLVDRTKPPGMTVAAIPSTPLAPLDAKPSAEIPVAAPPKQSPQHTAGGSGYVAVIIDDMGVDQKRSKRVVALDPAVTLSYLPYGRNLDAQTVEAMAAGHELMLHMPMEPEDPRIDPGPHALRLGKTAGELRADMKAQMNAFTGYLAVNNHMGSKFTESVKDMNILMAELKELGVAFIDSRTSPKSQAENVARQMGVAVSGRDVFLDHVETTAAVEKALRQLENHARRHGTAIAIGHPKDVTIEALKRWIPTLQARGITLVPASAIVNRRAQAGVDQVEKTTAVKPQVQPAQGGFKIEGWGAADKSGKAEIVPSGAPSIDVTPLPPPAVPPTQSP